LKQSFEANMKLHQKRRRIRCYWRINFYVYALEVNKLVKTGTDKEALNTFMKRVLGSIDQNRIQVLIIITHSNPSAFFLKLGRNCR
jgi:hypothetical protein